MTTGDDPVEVPASGGRWRLATNLFLVAFIALQFAVPLRGFVRAKHDTRGDLSWNMYSKRYSCRVNYVVHEPDGSRNRIDHKPYFRRSNAAGRVFHRDVLPRFNAHLCEELRGEGRLGALQGSVRCSLNFGPREELLRRGVDLCSTTDYGVVR